MHDTLRSGSLFASYVIAVADNLSVADLASLATRHDNEHVRADAGYDVLMERAGFSDIELVDVTAQYLTTLRAWRSEWLHNADAFVGLIGEEEYRMRIRRRDSDIANVEDGLLVRYRISAVRP